MAGAAEDEIAFARGDGEFTHQVPLRTHASSAPWGEVAVVHRKVAVVLGDGDDVFCSGVSEAINPLIGVALVRSEEGDEVFVTELIWVAVVVGMPLHVGRVHMGLVPLVEASRDGVEAPVNEDAELRFVEPARYTVVGA